MKFNTSWLLLVAAYIAGMTIMSIGCGETDEVKSARSNTRIEGASSESGSDKNDAAEHDGHASDEDERLDGKGHDTEGLEHQDKNEVEDQDKDKS